MQTANESNAAQSTSPAAPRGFADGYVPRRADRDEMLEVDGSLRPHWRMFVNMIDDLGGDELLRRRDQARRLIRENGITYNVYGEADGLDRPWALDLVPLQIGAAEWRKLGEALDQRARLLDLLLADIYGPARCLTSGTIPAELVYANVGFLRACHGVRPPKDRWLHLYAADVVRAGEGRFVVLGDRTQAPSGAGYALENRIVLSRVLPNIFRQCNVMRLAPFFITLRQTLASLAPANRENPRVVLLTPGPYSETFFEHAYLASYLGYALVQSNDLTVRDARVYLKTLGGLQRVDVILRRTDDDYCDPLELYSRSFLGVPGLLRAVREGNVAVANALGSGMLQAPAILPFLPRLCRELLSEDLRIDSVRTWWCGDHDSLKFVLDNLRNLVIKPAFPTRSAQPVFGEELTSAAREQLAYRIASRPAEYVAQEYLEGFTAPALLGGGVESRRFVLRTYLTTSDQGYALMSGGLARVTGSEDSRVVSLQRDGGSKDTWVLADGPVGETTLLAPASAPLELSRGGGDLPSRAADDLYWLGRYIQRAEAIARTARCVFGRISGQGGAEGPRTIDVLVHALLDRIDFVSSGGTERDLAAAVFDTDDPSAIRATIGSVHTLARALRDRVSGDAWRILQTIRRDVAEFDNDAANDPVAGVLEFLNRLVGGLLAFSGVVADSMTRGQSWRFLDMGLRVERGLCVASLLRNVLSDPVADEGALLDAVLEITDSALTYRRRYLTRLDAAAVVDLLLADESNPRSVAYQVLTLEQHLAQLPRDGDHPRRSPDRQMAHQLLTMLRLADVQSACHIDDGHRPELADLLDEAGQQISVISELLTQIYFSHARASRRVLGSAGGGGQ